MPRALSLLGLSSLLLVALAPSLSAATPHKAGKAARALAAAPTAGSADARYTDVTPDAMIDAARARAIAGKTDHAAVGAIATILTLADRAEEGVADRALAAIAADEALAADVRDEARLAVRALAADEGEPAGVHADEALGVVTHLALAGPFRDTGGGVTRKEGPEAPGGVAMDPKADYSWGTVLVRWRALPPPFAQAAGVPEDVFVSPRRESCSYVATRLVLEHAEPIVVRLASTGQARLTFDGADVGSSQDVHQSALFDRIAGRVDAAAGEHVLEAKVCTSALSDDGRFRLRVTDPKGHATDARMEVGPPKGHIAIGKQKITRLPTPLERTLETKRGADMDTLLDAILARTLAGADDAKSPRAPGLLDAFTHASGLDPDRLAMAGWVAPSGSNRSGWLNLAREQAAKAHDGRAEAFASRRLIAQRLNARMPDWARATANGSIAGAKDDEAALLDAMVNEALGTDALRLRAYQRLSAVALARGKAAPTSLLEELASLASSYDPGLEKKVRVLLRDRGERGAGYVSSVARSGSADALKTAAVGALQTGAVDDADDAIGIAHVLGNAGIHDEALVLFSSIAAWAPNRAGSWSGMSEEARGARPQVAEAAAHLIGAHTAAQLVEGSLRRARELEPSEAKYRALLALRAKDHNESPEAHEDEKYLVPASVILARRQGVPKHPDVADRELHWVRAVVMHKDRRVSQLIQYAREIVIPPRSQEELYEDIPAEGDLTEILHARVYRKDGGTAFPLEEVSEGARPRIRWPELEPGDTVEVAIRTWTDHAVGGRGDPPYYFLDYAGSTSSHPIVYNEVDVEAPTRTPIYVDVVHAAPGSFRRTEKDENGRHVTRLIWTKPPSVPEEPMAPALSEIIPVIAGSTFKNWKDFRAWYEEAVQGFTVPDEQVKRLAAELTKGKTTREAKLKALFDFVADDIRYVNYVSGEFWLPNRPQQLLARREGDCDDKAILLITLLRAVGIQAQEVMVQTRLTGQPTVVLAKNVAVPLFDHGIAFLPGPGGGTYLDATSPQSRLGPLPSMDARAVALRLDNGPAEIVHLPASSPDDHGSEVVWKVTLKKDGSGDLAGEEHHTGDGAFFLRSFLKEPDGRAQYVEDNLIGGWFPTVHVDKDVQFDGELPHGAAVVKYKAHSDGLARKEHGDLVVPLSPSWTLTSSLAPLVKRTLPVSLPPNLAPSHQARTMRVTAPAGYVWGDLPPGGTVDGGEFGRATLEVTRDPHNPRVAIVKRSVIFDLHLVPVDKYLAWRAFLQHIDGLMHRTLRAVLAGGAK